MKGKVCRAGENVGVGAEHLRVSEPGVPASGCSQMLQEKEFYFPGYSFRS